MTKYFFRLKNDRPDLLAIIAIVLGIACMGFIPIFVRLSEVGSASTAIWRNIMAAPILLCFVMSLPSSQRPTQSSWTKLLIISVIVTSFFSAATLYTSYVSFHITSVANATLLSSLAPLFTILLNLFFFKEKAYKIYFLCLLLAIIGMGFLIKDSLTINADQLVGDGLSLVTAFLLACFFMMFKYIRQSLSSFWAVFMVNIISLLFLFPISWHFGEVFWPQTSNGWWIIVGMAIVTTIIGMNLISYALAQLPTFFSSLTTMVQPVSAAFLAWIILGETISIDQFVGGFIILSTLFMAHKKPEVEQNS